MLFVMAGLVALAACGEPLDKKAMQAGCEAAATAVSPELAGAALDYRAFVGREAILRFHIPRDGSTGIVNVKCKVDNGGALKRLTIGQSHVTATEFDTARAAFAAAARP